MDNSVGKLQHKNGNSAGNYIAQENIAKDNIGHDKVALDYDAQ